MEEEILKPDQFRTVEVPEFLFEKTKKRITEIEQKSSIQSRLLLAAAMITLFINIGVVGNYLSRDTSSETTSNPYSYTNLYQLNYE